MRRIGKRLRSLHQTIQKITTDFDSRWHFNTSIAALMELTNELLELEDELSGAALGQICRDVTLLLTPFAPYTAQTSGRRWARRARFSATLARIRPGTGKGRPALRFPSR